jgi:hypothetical protein
MHRHPTKGIKGAKPRLPKTNGKLRTKAEISRLSKEYLEVRNVQMRAKAFIAETNAAARCDELIEKRLVEQQAAYLPSRCVENLEHSANLGQADVGLKDAARASDAERDGNSLLADLKDLPSRLSVQA